MEASFLHNDIHFKSKIPCKILILAGVHYYLVFGLFIVAKIVIPCANAHVALLYDYARDCYCPHHGYVYGYGYGYARGCGSSHHGNAHGCGYDCVRGYAVMR